MAYTNLNKEEPVLPPAITLAAANAASDAESGPEATHVNEPTHIRTTTDLAGANRYNTRASSTTSRVHKWYMSYDG